MTRLFLEDSEITQIVNGFNENDQIRKCCTVDGKILNFLNSTNSSYDLKKTDQRIELIEEIPF